MSLYMIVREVICHFTCKTCPAAGRHSISYILHMKSYVTLYDTECRSLYMASHYMATHYIIYLTYEVICHSIWYRVSLPLSGVTLYGDTLYHICEVICHSTSYPASLTLYHCIYSLLHLESYLTSISSLNLLGLFSTERCKRDLENPIIDWDWRMKKRHSKFNRLYLCAWLPGDILYHIEWHMNESWLTYRWVMVHVNESWHFLYLDF